MNAPDPNGDVRGALELGVRAATAYERPDLADRLKGDLAQVNRPEIQLVAVGEFKQGKSSLVNALVNVNICPVDDDIATAVHTVVKYGPERRAHALVRPAGSVDADVRRIPIEMNQIRDYATEHQGQLDPNIQVQAVEIELPRKLLEDGIVVIDTPGVGGLGSAHAAAGLRALSLADAALFISDASQEYTRAEMDYLAQAVEMCPSVICVMTKLDLYPNWRTVLDINRGHLNRLGHGEIPILPVSSSLRVEGINRKDKEINAQSGFPQLVQRVTDDIVADNARQKREVARNDLLSVCEQLMAQFEPKRVALSDPNASADLLASLERAKADAESLRSQVSRWNVTLNDGVSDLTSDVDHDLRGRIRQILADSDHAIEGNDPIRMWDEFEPWMTSAVSQAVVANYRFLTERSAQLSLEVAQHFDTGHSQLLAQLDINSASQALDKVNVDPDFEMDASGAGSKSFTALRGGYGGALMGVFASGPLGAALGVVGLATLAPVLPFAVGGGLFFMLGKKSLKDEKDRALQRRRSDAKNAVRRYCDEVSFQVSKDSRDTLRLVQRQLRDHYSTRAEELNKSTGEALKSATSAAKVAEADRAKQLRDVTAELERIEGLRKRADALIPTAVRH